MTRQADDAPVTWGDLRRVYKKLDGRISELWDEMNKSNESQTEFWNEHEDKINRLRRAVKRLEVE